MHSVRFIFKINIILLFFLYSNSICCQISENSIYSSFDKMLGTQSLAFTNGAIHLNNDKTVKNKHRYFENDAFSRGEINYNDQLYYNLNLKYDLYNDDLVVNVEENLNYSGLNLVSENLRHFVILNKKFVNSNSFTNFPVDFKKGFYEEIKFPKNVTLYVKYFKTKKEVIDDKSIIFDYKLQNNFVLLKNNVFYEINSKNKIAKIFTNSKREIDKFYDDKKSLEKENKALFIAELIKILSLE